MAEEYEVTYKGKNYIIEADCRKSDDRYIGSNTFDIDIISVKELVPNVKTNMILKIDKGIQYEFEQCEVELDDLDIQYLASELAYICADEYHRG